MFNVIYRWRLKPGREEEFRQAWSEATDLIRKHRGGQGSRLHRCDDGSYLAYARWTDRAVWERAPQISLPDDSVFRRMQACCESAETPIKLELVEDKL